MKFKTSVSLMVAVVLGLITAKVGLDMVRKYGGAAGRGTKVVVSTRAMEPGYVIQPSDLTLMDVPVNMMPAKAIFDVKAAVGRTVLASAAKDYPLLDNQLSAPGSGSGLQAMVPKGMRAVTVDVSESSGVAGLLVPGCFVDVIATLRRGEQTVARTIVENVKVQFVQRGRSSSSSLRSAASSSAPGTSDLGPARTVTLLVTPKQAAAIELANSSGKPRLILRGDADGTASGDSTVSQNELLGLPDEPATKPEVAQTPVVDDGTFDNVAPLTPDNKRPVQIIRGGSEETIYYDENGNGKEEGSGATTADKKPAVDEPRTVSGTSPDPAPRMDAGHGKN